MVGSRELVRQVGVCMRRAGSTSQHQHRAENTCGSNERADGDRDEQKGKRHRVRSLASQGEQ